MPRKKVISREQQSDGGWIISYSDGSFEFTEPIDDVGGIPEGCRACGGDYPNCVDSCPLYDD